MILQNASILSLFGMGLWILGYVFNHEELGVIGGTIVVGVGSLVMQGGLEYQSGKTVEVQTNYTVVEGQNGTTWNKSSETRQVDFQYQQVPLPQQLTIGFLIALVGGLGVLRSINRFSERKA